MEKHHHSTQSTNHCSPTSSPTTFVQADTNTFRDLVQKLTGLSGDSSEKLPVTQPGRHYPKLIPATPADPTAPRRSPFKLQERRQHTMRKLEIKLSLANLHTSHNIPSPVTPLYFPSSGSESPSSPAAAVSDEEKAIAEKGFYLHPSPLSTPRGSDPPELLPLFPLSSPTHHDHNKSQQSAL